MLILARRNQIPTFLKALVREVELLAKLTYQSDILSEAWTRSNVSCSRGVQAPASQPHLAPVLPSSCKLRVVSTLIYKE